MPAPPKVNTLVTLYVNTANFDQLTQQNITDFVWMADTDGDVTDDGPGQVANYVTNVLKNGNVTWVGGILNIPSTPSDYVLITDISPITGINITKEPASPGNGNTTHVNGRVSGNAPSGLLEYTISIKVVRVDASGNRSEKDFTVDPKIQIH